MEETKHPGGRPEKYSPESLLEKAQAYFDFCDDKKNRLDKGIAGKIPKPKTLSGLCLWLGVYKDYISEKAKDNKFSETISYIRLQVLNDVEERTLQGVYHGTSGIFNLKNNFGWTDKIETKNETTLTAALKIEQVQTMSDEDLLALTK